MIFLNFSLRTSTILGVSVASAMLLNATPLYSQSLWINEANNEQGMFADIRARNVGDLLTIVIQESTVSTQAQELKTYDNNQSGMGIFVNGLLDQFLKAVPAMLQSATGAKTTDSSGNATVTIPTLDVAAKSDFTGGGQTTSRLALNNRTAVTVVDVLPNGNLVIEGAKVIRVAQESQYASIRGVVRQADVQKDNTVLSTNIADAQVEFVPEGDLTDAQKKGWLLRFYDKIKPF